MKAYYRPKYWIKVATGSFLKDNNGALYPIRKGVGITLDKEFWMPESGEAEFQLLFPPIPENVTSLDFSEGDFDGYGEYSSMRRISVKLRYLKTQ